MKIVRFEAENYKRLKAVEITPDGSTVVIGGRNAQGKSSVLDAIWAALGGREGNKAAKPIRDGEDKARVRLDLGEVIVTRKWTASGSTVTVESADGATFKSPQAILDGLVGALSFDPLAFTRLTAKQQRDALLGLAEIDADLDAIEQERDQLFSQRTEVGRRGKELGEITFDPQMPSEEQSAAIIISNIRTIEEKNRARRDLDAQIDAQAVEVGALSAEINALTARLEAATASLRNMRNVPVDPIVDTGELEASLASVEETNQQIRANNIARERHDAQSALREEYESLTGQLRELDEKKAAALSVAKFPVDGLGFDADGVTFNGVPFSQASSAEQIRVSLAMAIAANPKLRVVRIMDGSLLDEENLRLVAEVAADNDMQVWIERVGAGDGIGVVIEDGEVIP